MREVHFTERAERVLRLAHEGAAEMGHSHVGTEHLLLGLAREGDGIAARTLGACGMTPARLGELLRENVGVGAPTLRTPQGLTPRARQSIELAAAEATALGHAFVGAEHLLLGVLRENDCQGCRILLSAGVEPQKLYDMTLRFSGSPASGSVEPAAFSGSNAAASPLRPRGDTRTLNQFGRDLTQSAREGVLDPVIGRDAETDRVVAILTRRQKNNPVLIGEPGVGKTAVAEGLARRLAEGRVPDSLRGRRLVSLDLAGMIAGTKYRGEFEERVRTILEEARRAGNVILFIDELHTVVGAGAAEGAIDAANILKPALSRGELRVVGATTIAEYRKYIERDAALERRFQPVLLEEPTRDEARAILEGLRPRYEAHHGLRISDEALDAAISLSVRYLPDRFLPDKAVDLIDEAAASTRMRLLGGGALKKLARDGDAAERELEDAVRASDFVRAAAVRDKKRAIDESLARERADNLVTLGVVTAADVAHACAAWTRIPVEELTEEEETRLARLEDVLRERVVGQDEAVAAVSRAVRLGRVGLADPNRPVGSFLFLGPSGVGKTETARALAEALFGDENALIRFDMSEYAEKHTISRLIGSPPGYVGHEEGGQLTGRVRAKPYSVVLFDELEKAHPDIFHLMLQILEDGRLTDAQGRRADFRSAVVIMTSNLGAGTVSGTASPVGFSSSKSGADAREDRVRGEMRAFFRPEFLNRLDAAVVFRPLGEDALREIARRLLAASAKRFAHRGYTLVWDEDAVASLAREGLDPRYGARPLRRAITSRVEEPAAAAILSGALTPGMEVRLEGETLRFAKPDAPGEA